MKAASFPEQRPRDAKLLVIDAAGRLQHALRARLADFLYPGDLLVANDAATLPASLAGKHLRSGAAIELRLAGRLSLRPDDIQRFTAVVFGAGDHRTRTEDRDPPPELRAGDAMQMGSLVARVEQLLGHPRLIGLHFDATPDAIRAAIAHHGRPIQYAHVKQALALWDVWTRIAALPVAFEAPSAGYMLDWQMLRNLRERGVGFATLTHAAGISSTGDAALDARLPFDEAYRIPPATVAAIECTHRSGARVVALGTTVVRALEHAAGLNGTLRAGAGLADQRIGPRTRLRLIDALVSGTHERGTSHFEMLRAFTGDAVLERAGRELERLGYRSHEFGDSVLVERTSVTRRCARPQPASFENAVARSWV